MDFTRIDFIDYTDINMTQEEKAKAYDEAIKKINECPTDKYGCLLGIKSSDIFPHLFESEDERIRKVLLRCCDDWEKGQFGCMKKEDVPLIRAYLEKQKEQKPAEWSEEDKETIERICANLEYLVKEAGCDSKIKEKLEERIKWMRRLKSLRPQPHWKPSEEQMKALEHFIRSWGESGTMSSQNTILCAAKSLHTDLQKLL